jgi:hypothetical protein
MPVPDAITASQLSRLIGTPDREDRHRAFPPAWAFVCAVYVALLLREGCPDGCQLVPTYLIAVATVPQEHHAAIFVLMPLSCWIKSPRAFPIGVGDS